MADTSSISEHELSDEEIMAVYNITSVPTDRFHYKSFRYSRLSDAIAQAKRDRSIAPPKGN
jgi:hypothetical protein